MSVTGRQAGIACLAPSSSLDVPILGHGSSADKVLPRCKSLAVEAVTVVEWARAALTDHRSRVEQLDREIAALAAVEVSAKVVGLDKRLSVAEATNVTGGMPSVPNHLVGPRSDTGLSSRILA